MNKLILYLRRSLHNCRKCGFSHARLFFELCNGLIRKAWRVKNTRSGGFSILEMTVVLGIVAVTSIAGIKVLNGKIEQNAVDRIVADLTIVTEAAYACYATGRCKGVNGWEPVPVEDETASIHLDLFLPQDFSANYKVQTTQVSGTATSKLVIRAVNLPNKDIAQRVANTFGSLAAWNENMSDTVVVTLGIPGVASAISARKKSPTSCTDPSPYKILGSSPRKYYPSTMYIGEHRIDPSRKRPVISGGEITDEVERCRLIGRLSDRPRWPCYAVSGDSDKPNITTLRWFSLSGFLQVDGKRCGIDGEIHNTTIVKYCYKRRLRPSCTPLHPTRIPGHTAQPR